PTPPRVSAYLAASSASYTARMSQVAPTTQTSTIATATTSLLGGSPLSSSSVLGVIDGLLVSYGLRWNEVQASSLGYHGSCHKLPPGQGRPCRTVGQLARAQGVCHQLWSKLTSARSAWCSHRYQSANG